MKHASWPAKARRVSGTTPSKRRRRRSSARRSAGEQIQTNAGGRPPYDAVVRETLARVASNEAAFAAANDAVADVALRLGPRRFVPFLCECADPACVEVARLSLGEYAAVRLFADRYLVSPLCRSGERAGTLLIEQNERYSVVDRPAVVH